MTAAELKASILDLAIRGKLVSQDPSDEPAAELLKRIKAEKAKLVAAKKIKKEKPLAPITDDEKPFDLPESWVWCRLGEVATFINGDRGKNYPSKDKLSLNGYAPFISASNIENRTIKKDGLLYLSEEQYSKLRSGRLEKNDIALCIRGSLGKFCIYPYEIGSIASSLVIMRTERALLLDYISAYLESQLFEYNIRRYDNGTAQPNLSAADVLKFTIPLPPLEEQKMIVAKIEELMPLVERYGKAEERRLKLNAALPTDLEKSILQEAIQGHLTAMWREETKVDESAAELLKRIKAEKAKLIAAKKIKKEKPLAPITDDEKPFYLPEGWEWCRLGELVRAISGVSYQKDDVLNSGPVRIFRGGNVKEDASVIAKDDDVFLPITYKDDDNSLQLNDVIIVASTGSSAVIGRPGLVKELYPNTQIGAFLKIIRTYKEGYAPFIHLIFMSEYYRENIRQAVKGIGIKNLKVEYISNMPIPLPPLAEQKAIVAKVEELLAAIKGLNAK